MENLTKEELITIIIQQREILNKCHKLMSVAIVDIAMRIESINRLIKVMEETVIATDGGIAAP